MKDDIVPGLIPRATHAALRGVFLVGLAVAALACTAPLANDEDPAGDGESDGDEQPDSASGASEDAMISRFEKCAPYDDGEAGKCYQWPVTPSNPITSGYGWRNGRPHRGLDFGTPAGTCVRASSQGVVQFAGWGANENGRNGYGYVVDIKHTDGATTRYAHLMKGSMVVRTGDTVERGAFVARSGSTGSSTGPHLHFEVRPSGLAQDPKSWLCRR